MKHRRLLQSLPLLPTIMETLEDSPLHTATCQSTQTSQSLDDYMSSIQALAPTLPRGSPRAHRTTCRPSGAGASSTEDCSLRRQQDSRGKDPVDWLFFKRSSNLLVRSLYIFHTGVYVTSLPKSTEIGPNSHATQNKNKNKTKMCAASPPSSGRRWCNNCGLGNENNIIEGATTAASEMKITMNPLEAHCRTLYFNFTLLHSQPTHFISN
uniref:Uncharacterized protein n=1 Tax=Hippocampus comes TaxID=109280 RepID=A0A3Q2YJF9_HIPCM